MLVLGLMGQIDWGYGGKKFCGADFISHGLPPWGHKKDSGE